MRSSIADFILFFAFVQSDELLILSCFLLLSSRMSDFLCRTFEVDVHISGGALLQVSVPQGPQLQSMVRVQLNYLDMRLNWLTALNA